MPFVNPFQKYTCPFCLGKFYLHECDIVSTISHDQNGELLVLHPAPADFLSRFWTRPLAGPKYIEELATRRCPRCAKPLPRNLENMDSQIIGLIGGTGAGKSHYIASLIKELNRGDVRQALGLKEFSPATQQIEDRYRDKYYRPVFVDRQALPLSKPGDVEEPLIYRMVFERPSGFPSVRRINLILFDGAGEAIQNEEQMVKLKPYIWNAAGLIFLADPFAIEGIRNRMPAKLQPQTALDYKTVPDRILASIVNIYRDYRQGSAQAQDSLSVPIAITLAKSDVLRYIAPDLGTQSVFLRDTSYAGGFNPQELLTVDQEVQEMLSRYGGQDLLQTSRALTNRTFCAVSATGGSADGNGAFPREPQPSRCLDPLIWLLWKLSVIEESQPSPAAQQVLQPAP